MVVVFDQEFDWLGFVFGGCDCFFQLVCVVGGVVYCDDVCVVDEVCVECWIVLLYGGDVVVVVECQVQGMCEVEGVGCVYLGFVVGVGFVFLDEVVVCFFEVCEGCWLVCGFDVVVQEGFLIVGIDVF